MAVKLIRTAGRPVVSFEFFPTKTDEGERALLEKTIPALRALAPDFCSVTYGAGGSTREKTLTIVDRIQREQQMTAMAHLTCVNATIDETHAVLQQTRALGIKNILALRGDPPSGSTEFVKTEGGFEYSYQLVEAIREFGGFSIGVAGFPEGHIACHEGKQEDWQRLKTKIDHVLRGIAVSDFADVLFRAAAFAHVVATGRAVLDVPAAEASRMRTLADQLEAAARQELAQQLG